MRYLFVGDVHGNREVVHEALCKDVDRIVFVGDFVDSFTYSTADMEACLHMIAPGLEAGDIIALYGNHEMSYLEPQLHRCSGWRSDTQIMMNKPEIRDILKHFRFYYKPDPGILVTHAGLSNCWADEWPDHPNWNTGDRHPVKDSIGSCRGGSNHTGGILWCDFNQEFEPIPELAQIFGHTRGSGIRKRGDNFCIDCLENAKPYQFLLTDI